MNEQCKEIEENNRMGRMRLLFKKIGDMKGIFHARMGTIKDRNGKDLTEAEEIKKRWQEYTEELYKNVSNDLDNHNGVVTHLEPDILECEVEWALKRITTNKAREGDSIPAELFQILRDDGIKVLHSIYQQICRTQQWPQDWKSCFYSSSKERQCQRMFKLPYNCIMLKILQARLQQYINQELPDVRAGFRRGRGTRDQIANIC